MNNQIFLSPAPPSMNFYKNLKSKSKIGVPTTGHELLEKAVKAGGKKLDSFDGNFRFYLRNGFDPVSWTAFDEKYIAESDEGIVQAMYCENKKDFAEGRYVCLQPSILLVSDTARKRLCIGGLLSLKVL